MSSVLRAGAAGRCCPTHPQPRPPFYPGSPGKQGVTPFPDRGAALGQQWVLLWPWVGAASQRCGFSSPCPQGPQGRPWQCSPGGPSSFSASRSDAGQDPDGGRGPSTLEAEACGDVWQPEEATEEKSSVCPCCPRTELSAVPVPRPHPHARPQTCCMWDPGWGWRFLKSPRDRQCRCVIRCEPHGPENL